MHEIIAKIARFAVSKLAAFGYAVAVGVAGNLIFHFVQPGDPTTAIVPAAPTAVREGLAAAGAAPTGAAAPMSVTASPAVPPADTAPVPTHVSLSAAPMRPPASKPAVASTPQPEPRAVIALPTPAVLPSPASLPTPALKPTAVPPMAPREAALDPTPTTSPEWASSGLRPAAPPGRSAGQSLGTALPPLGPAIDVAVPPTPPAPPRAPPSHLAAPQALPAAPMVPADEAAMEKQTPSSLEFSDVWHPYRAVKKGLHWAGEQVPVIGGDEAAPHAAAATAAAQPASAAPEEPISLLPVTGRPVTSENADASIPPPKPAAPGPGSGGLY